MKLIKLAATVAMVAAMGSANANLIRFEFTGIANGSRYMDGPDVGMAVPGAPAVGTAISGAYVFDTTVPDTYQGSMYGSYHYAIKTWDSSIGDLAYHFDLSVGGFSRIDTEDGYEGGGINRDLYYAYVTQWGSGLGLTGPTLGGYAPTHFQLSVFDFEEDQNPDLLTGDSMLISPPDLSLATDYLNLGTSRIRVLFFQFENQAGEKIRILGQLDSIVSSEVPEPATLTLTALGLIGLGIARRRRTP